MKKFLKLVLVIVFLAAGSYGCVEVTTYSHDRVDLEPRGNKGYICGKPPLDTSAVNRKERTVLEFDITIPSSKDDFNFGVKKKVESNLEESVEQNSSIIESVEEEKESLPADNPQVQPEESSPKIK